MTEQDKKFLEDNKDADFVVKCRVGERGVVRYFTEKYEWEEFRDRAWDSGHYLEINYLKK